MGDLTVVRFEQEEGERGSLLNYDSMTFGACGAKYLNFIVQFSQIILLKSPKNMEHLKRGIMGNLSVLGLKQEQRGGGINI